MPGSIGLIWILYDMQTQLWKHRNDLVKGEEKDWKWTQACREEIIILHMGCPQNLSIEDKCHYDPNPDLICTWTIGKQSTWIVGAKAIVEKYKKIRAVGIRRFLANRSNDHTALQRGWYHWRMNMRIRVLLDQVAEMQRWKWKGLNQYDQWLLNQQGVTITDKSTSVQRWWLSQMQAIRRPYENE